MPRAVVAVLAIAAVGVTYLAVLAPAATLERVTNFQNAGGTGRSDLWNVALRVAEDHPVLGVGAGNFILVEPEYSASGINISRIDIVFDQTKVVHNTFLQLQTELGAIGLAAFLLVVGAAVVGSFRSISRMRGVPLDVELLVRGFTVGLLGVLAAYSFESSQYEKQLWLMLGVGLAIPSILRRLQAEALPRREDGARWPSGPAPPAAASSPATTPSRTPGSTRSPSARPRSSASCASSSACTGR